ncbi:MULTISPECIES: 3D-(3,5/4)-trihydroxycyclohexane-1,2-dione acylhydrolase (decyclizing) [unclassified Aeromicrobium]|uniref:3D-(3,5/4)-trihydroxycyclohexane-1,2-dione acylhydrolase (decyclizing) n=1 Tax=unclassified Aeromicrobium TaxID=2633570 RepID=UPI0006FC69BE|nr:MULTISPECIES: 3D-(3,5/4)-trihydroxycyclohexane-1,2-dione acylhydrolase (decyclizing) [unclassified Aeromicrobium]KQO37178.1 3D-(3,5/4)-trihydroxycyclohexane-1,2-dione acylhydrolase (decyclizing) [Aeromicrobium sp. Leaf245]KQP84723.1 3D-(3,5/4)-trihydroxycyclohexane-1,2-dione acylhydrolase (decyclizing) [Aeromicrobium sp. Leaf291]
MTQTRRLTVAQATIAFLGAQYSERDGVEHKLFAGAFGIFGHGNVAGLGQALLQAELEDPDLLPYVLGRNEQAMVHSAVAYARQKDRLQTWAVTTSVGPGATNMVTGAALATINRLPVLLLPADTFADRSASPLLQELELPQSGDVTVNDTFRAVSRYFDRVWRPEQLPSALLAAMRVLTDPAETGAVTICFPQDVQAQAHDWPVELFEKRVWHVARPVPERSLVDVAAEAIRSARRPVLVAGGGVHYSQATEALAAFSEATGIPVGQSQAGKGTLVYDHPQCLGAIGSTGTTAANAIARDADLVIGVGTRYSDFTTASRTAFQAEGVRFVNVNVAAIDSVKQSGLAITADARETLDALRVALDGHRVDDAYVEEYQRLAADWDATVEATYVPETPDRGAGGLPTQGEVLGLVNELSDPRDVVLCAAGSMPGDLHKLWRTRDSKGYHVEYGYSCMGYEVAGGIGAAMAERGDRDVFVMVGDGSYLMMATELVTAVQEGVKIIVVLVQNHGYASIGSLSESLGSQRFGTRYRYRAEGSGRLDGEKLPVDLAANAESLGVEVVRVDSAGAFGKAVTAAKESPTSTVIHVETDPLVPAPSSESWWDVPVSETSTLESTQQAYETYRSAKADQHLHLTPPPTPGA